MTIDTRRRAKTPASPRLDWIAPSVHRLAAGAAEEEGTFQTDLGELKS